MKKAGAPGPRGTSSRLLSSSFFPRSLPPTTDCCSVFLLLCLSALSQAALLCHNRSPPLSAALSHAVLVSRRKKERCHLARFVQALFVLISKVTTPRVVCHSDVCPLF